MSGQQPWNEHSSNGEQKWNANTAPSGGDWRGANDGAVYGSTGAGQMPDLPALQQNQQGASQQGASQQGSSQQVYGQQDYGQQSTGQQSYGDQNTGRQNYAQQNSGAAQSGQDAAGQSQRSNRKWLIPVAILAAVLLVAGAVWGALSLFGKSGRGAGSPEEAVSNFVTNGTSFDLVSVASTVAPSESTMFEGAMQRLLTSDFGDSGDGESLRDNIAQLKDVVHSEVTGIEYDTEELADGVQRVTITDGELKVDGDRDQLREVVAALTRSIVFEQHLLMGDSEDEAREWADDRAQDYLDSQSDDAVPESMVDLGESGTLPDFIVVNEDGRWYVSLVLTVINAVSVGLGGEPVGDFDIVDGAGANSPEEAGMTAVSMVVQRFGMLNGSADFAEGLAYPERIAASMLLEMMGSSGYSGESPEFDMSGGFTKSEVNGVTIVRPDNLEVTVESPYGDSSSVTFDGDCMTNSYRGPGDWGDSEQCLSDIHQLKVLGLSDLGFAVVNEGGKWYFSVYKTVQVWLETAVDHYLELRNDGKLSELQR